MSAFTAGWLDRETEAIAGFLPFPLRAVFPVNLHHVRRKLTLLIQLLKNNENCWFEKLTIGGHRRLSAVHLTLQCYFTSSFGICQGPFLGSFIRFLQLTLLLYIKGKILSSNGFWPAEIAGCYCRWGEKGAWG